MGGSLKVSVNFLDEGRENTTHKGLLRLVAYCEQDKHKWCGSRTLVYEDSEETRLQ